MGSSGNFAVLHEILTKIAEDSTAYVVSHVPASKPSLDGDHTSGSISGETESNSSESQQSFDADRTMSARDSRPSQQSSQTQAYLVQSVSSVAYEFDPDNAAEKSKDSPRVRSNGEMYRRNR